MIISESSHDHLGASCSNMGRIRTKEDIAVDTHLIGILPNLLGGFLIIFESQLNPFGPGLWSYSNWKPLSSDLSQVYSDYDKVCMAGCHLPV